LDSHGIFPCVNKKQTTSRRDAGDPRFNKQARPRQCKRAAAEINATASSIAARWGNSESPSLLVEGRKEGGGGGGELRDGGEEWETDLDRADDSTCANSLPLERTSLAAISEFAAAILSIEAPPLLTEAEILCLLFLSSRWFRKRKRNGRGEARARSALVGADRRATSLPSEFLHRKYFQRKYAASVIVVRKEERECSGQRSATTCRVHDKMDKGERFLSLSLSLSLWRARQGKESAFEEFY
jgi:hypothetical protein